MTRLMMVTDMIRFSQIGDRGRRLTHIFSRFPCLCGARSSRAPVAKDAAEPDVTGRGIGRLGLARSGPVAAAVIGGAQVRAALEDLARNPDVGPERVIALLWRSAARVLGKAAGFRPVGLVLGRVPV